MRTSILAGLLLLSMTAWAGEPAKKTPEAAAAPEAAPAPVQTVTVTAVGQADYSETAKPLPVAKENARKAALRAAVEQVCGTYVTSFSESKDFTLLQDLVTTNVSGYVSNWSIVSEEVNEADWLVTTTIKAEVARGEIDKDAAGIATLMRLKGQRRVFVLIDDSTEDAVGPSGAQQLVVRKHGRMEALLREQLRKDGMFVLDSNLADGKLKVGAKVSALTQAEAAEIADAVDADVIIYGRATQTLGRGPVAGVMMTTVQMELVLSATSPDAREEIANFVDVFSVSQHTEEHARDLAFKEGSQRALRGVRMKLYEAWRGQVMNSQRIKMTVTGLAGYGAFAELQQALKSQVSAVRDVSSARFNKGVGTLDVISAAGPEGLAAAVNDKVLGKGMKLRVDAVGANTLEIAVVGGK